MRLIIDAPDQLIAEAWALAVEESRDYARRYARPGWGWTFKRNGQTFWVRGIKGGISVSLSRSQSLSESKAAGPLDRNAPRDEQAKT